MLHFYLAGINDQNFLMRDRETGSWWQQVTGAAIAGPLRGAHLELLSSEETTFGLWREENPAGLVLAPVAADEKSYAHAGWQERLAKDPAVVPVPTNSPRPRDLVVGVARDGQAAAYPLAVLRNSGIIQDTLGGTPLLIALGPDQTTVRVFARRFAGAQGPAAPEFFRAVAAPASTGQQPPGAKPLSPALAKPAAETPPAWALVDDAGASRWNFRGCATAGPRRGECLARIPSLVEDWFDWLHYHPATRLYRTPGRSR